MNIVERVLGQRYRKHPIQHRPFSEFLDFKGTVKNAAEKNLTVGDYIDNPRRIDGLTPTEWTLRAMKIARVFDNVRNVCEIGPGSGRYLVKVHAEVAAAAYEIYETSAEWRGWLVNNNPWLTAKQCNGRTLAGTYNCSIDLIHAHRVFSGLPCLTVFSYWNEMIRVLRSGGHAVFDILPEETFTAEKLKAFDGECAWNWDWEPHIMPREFAIEFFRERGMHLSYCAAIPQQPSMSELLVFEKPANGGA